MYNVSKWRFERQDLIWVMIPMFLAIFSLMWDICDFQSKCSCITTPKNFISCTCSIHSLSIFSVKFGTCLFLDLKTINLVFFAFKESLFVLNHNEIWCNSSLIEFSLIVLWYLKAKLVSSANCRSFPFLYWIWYHLYKLKIKGVPIRSLWDAAYYFFTFGCRVFILNWLQSISKVTWEPIVGNPSYTIVK